MTRIIKDEESFYDEDNYLKASAINNNKYSSGSQVKLPRKLPQVPKETRTTRKPLTLPRDTEENEYEPAPNNSRSKGRNAISHSIPPPPAEENDDYELPPNFTPTSSREPFVKKTFPTVSDEEVYEDPDSKYQNSRRKTIGSSTTNVGTPPLYPKRMPPSKKTEEPKVGFFKMNLKQYVNVKRIFSPETAENTSSLDIPEKIFRTVKNIANDKKPRGTLGRPLPALPPSSEEKSSRKARIQIEVEQKNQDLSHPEVEYQNQTDTESKQEENLPEYLNTTEKRELSNVHSSRKSTQIAQVIPHPPASELLSEITQVKNKLANKTNPTKGIRLDESAALDLKRQLLERFRKKENGEKRGEISTLKPLPQPPVDIPPNLPSYFEQIEDEQDKGAEDFEDDEVEYQNQSATESNDEENLPEYLNTTEKKEPPKVLLRPKSSSTQMIAQVIPHQPPASQLLSEITEAKNKLANKTTPIKGIRLDDNDALDLKKQLLARFEKKKEKANDEKIGEIFTGKLLPQPPQNFPDSYPKQVKAKHNTGAEGFEEDEEVYDDIFNLNNEKFYRNTDRKGALLLLRDLGDGAFVLRPSKKFFLSITVKKNGKYFNLGIMKTMQQKIYCGEGIMRTPEFTSIKTFLDHFEHTPLDLQGTDGVEQVYLKKVLPGDRF
ncbi:hypothetical protein HHI36_013031 [Cryptolaemus montrouzieri]